MEQPKTCTCGKQISDNDADKHMLCRNSQQLKGPMDAGFDICAEVRRFLQEYDERKGRQPA